MSGGRRFELRRHLGEGTFGTVYLADMVSLGGFRTRVALKVLNTRWTGESDAGRRLRDEARVLGRLDHRNIVRVFDLVRVDGRWALVMEALKGADLEHVLAVMSEAGERFPTRAALELVVQVAQGLEAALHGVDDDERALEVVHRDIKPSNAILTRHGDVKLLDFGIAGSNMAGREAGTSRIGYGSVPYMSPERLRGLDADGSGDVYGLGAMIWEVLVGEPYGRAEPGRLENAEQAQEQGARLRAILADEPQGEDIHALITEMMGFLPDQRPGIRTVRERAEAMLVEASGEGLLAVARRFVGPAAARVETRDVTGVLSEESSGATGGADEELRVGRTITADDVGGDLFGASAEASDDPPSNRTLVAPDAIGLPEPGAQEEASGPAETPSPSPSRAPSGSAQEPPPVDEEVTSSLRWIVAAAAALLVVGAGAFSVLGGGREAPTGTVEPAVETRSIGTADQATTGGSVEAVPTGTAAEADPSEADPSDAGPSEAGPSEADPSDAGPSEAGPSESGPSEVPAAEAALSEAAPTEAPSGAADEAPAPGIPAPRTAVGSVPTPSAPAPAVAPSPAAVETVRMIKVVVDGAEGVTARCGDRDGAGTSSLVVRDAPVGACEVTALVGGRSLKGRIEVTGPAAFACAPTGEALSCR